jgi:putative ABC transport system substrate-binding protein
MPVIGFLNSGSAHAFAQPTAMFRRGLSEAGYVEGRNVTIEYRWAEGEFQRLASLASDLIQTRVAAVFAGGPPAAAAAKASTSTIPIVFTVGDDPVATGLVASLNRPGGNLTGASFFTIALASKRLELLNDLLPNSTLAGMIFNPTSPNADVQLRDAQVAARSLGKKLEVFRVTTEGGIDEAFAGSAQTNVGAVLVGTDPFFTSQRARLVASAARHRVPAIFALRDYVEAGDLMSYGASIADAYRHAGYYVGRILNGEHPSILPVMQSTRIELVINLKTAKALGIEVPATLLARADEVIE